MIIDDSSMGSEEEEECKRVPVRLLAQYQEQIEEETRKRRRLEEENLRLEREKLQLEADYRSALARSASGAPDALQGLQRSSLEEQAHRLQREVRTHSAHFGCRFCTRHPLLSLSLFPDRLRSSWSRQQWCGGWCWRPATEW